MDRRLLDHYGRKKRTIVINTHNTSIYEQNESKMLFLDSFFIQKTTFSEVSLRNETHKIPNTYEKHFPTDLIYFLFFI